MLMRALAEQLTHRIVLRRRLRKPFDNVRLHVSSEAGLRYLKPSLKDVDPMLMMLVDELVEPGAIVWDIGANIGLFSFTSALRAGSAGRVVAVEADTKNVEMLRRSARSQPIGSASVTVVPAAASAHTGFATFHIARRNRSTNALDGFGTTQTGGTRESQTVPTVTLDEMSGHFPMPSLLKIDVEGAELLVLEGAELILASGPTVVCEVADENAEAVRDVFTQHRYKLFDAAVTPPRQQLTGTAQNILAIA
jgi:FkbM family methyltransferase